MVVIDLGGPGQGDKKWAPLKQHLMLLKSCRISVARLVLNTKPSPQKSPSVLLNQCRHVAYHPEVESRTQGSRPRTQKKFEAKDSLSEDRTSRGQGQDCSRPRTEDTGASVLLKKRTSKIFFRGSPIHWRTQKFLIKEGLNHKSHDMTSSKFFQRGSFCGTKISYDERSEIVVACLHITKILQRKRA